MSGQLSMETWLLPKGATGAADQAAPLGAMQKFAPPMKRCTNLVRSKGNRCNGELLKSDSRKWCLKCRKQALKVNKTEAGKARAKRAKTSDKGKASKKRYKTSDKGKASKKRYKTSDKGKAYQKRENASRMSHLARSLLKMVQGVHPNPQSFRALGLFDDNADAEAFLESTKTEPWMQTASWGKRTATTLPQTALQIGHKIPKAWYRHDDDDEIKKAWSRTNLFAQCAVENHEAGDRNQLSREGWLALKPIWPKQCGGMTDEAAWEWASRNVDNATRKAARAAAKAAQAAAAAATAASTSGAGEAGPSDLNAVPESSSEEESGDEEADAAEAPDAYASEAESEEDEDEDEEESDDDDDSDSD